ncbi:hypothetical protein C8R46DRAFT_1196211 [Mycena filopes]|nr:hypothetical protein C8R46DRAFT_1196211 [Mycena filopes]
MLQLSPELLLDILDVFAIPLAFQTEQTPHRAALWSCSLWPGMSMLSRERLFARPFDRLGSFLGTINAETDKSRWLRECVHSLGLRPLASAKSGDIMAILTHLPNLRELNITGPACGFSEGTSAQWHRYSVVARQRGQHWDHHPNGRNRMACHPVAHCGDSDSPHARYHDKYRTAALAGIFEAKLGLADRCESILLRAGPPELFWQTGWAGFDLAGIGSAGLRSLSMQEPGPSRDLGFLQRCTHLERFESQKIPSAALLAAVPRTITALSVVHPYSTPRKRIVASISLTGDSRTSVAFLHSIPLRQNRGSRETSRRAARYVSSVAGVPLGVAEYWFGFSASFSNVARRGRVIGHFTDSSKMLQLSPAPLLEIIDTFATPLTFQTEQTPDRAAQTLASCSLALHASSPTKNWSSFGATAPLFARCGPHWIYDLVPGARMARTLEAHRRDSHPLHARWHQQLPPACFFQAVHPVIFQTPTGFDFSTVLVRQHIQLHTTQLPGRVLGRGARKLGFWVLWNAETEQAESEKPTPPQGTNSTYREQDSPQKPESPQSSKVNLKRTAQTKESTSAEARQRGACKRQYTAEAHTEHANKGCFTEVRTLNPHECSGAERVAYKRQYVAEARNEHANKGCFTKIRTLNPHECSGAERVAYKRQYAAEARHEHANKGCFT